MQMRLFPYILLAVALLAACTPIEELPPTGDVIADEPVTEVPAEEAPMDETPITDTAENATQDVQEPKAPAEENIYFTVEGVEGDLIRLSPEAVDPDGDRVRYSFGEPFGEDGTWQTSIGDEGQYPVQVFATDGKDTTTETIMVVVRRANRPPVINCAPVTVREGETVDLHDACTVTDEDDAEIVVTYGGWMSSWRKTVGYDDAGRHTVTITASDKRKGEVLHTVTRNVTVTVENVNRAPIFSDSFPTTISATEGDVITLPRDLITDPDGDRVTITYSEPFRDGIWKTALGDAGTYPIDVVASDGTMTAKRTVTVKIALRNTAPTLKQIGNITVSEGETIRLPISATDREGDPLTTTITGFMSTPTYTTTYDDAGEYTVKVTVTDGVFTTSEIVHITVADRNRPPVFVSPA